MSAKVCKYCGREFDSRNAEVVAGWVTCSEKCRKKLNKSVTAGDAAPAKSMGLGRLIMLVLMIWITLYAFGRGLGYIKPTNTNASPSAGK